MKPNFIKMNQNQDKTSLVLTNEYGEYTVSVNSELDTLEEVLERLVAPVLIAASFPAQLVSKRLDVEV